MVFFPHNHYQIVYRYFSVFQLVSTYCFDVCQQIIAMIKMILSDLIVMLYKVCFFKYIY